MELRGRGRHDGLFQVREKTVTATRVVFVLSMSYQGHLRHHLMEHPRNGAWTIDSSERVGWYRANGTDPTSTDGTLNSLVESF